MLIRIILVSDSSGLSRQNLLLICGLFSEQFSDLFLLFIEVSDREELVVDLLGIDRR
jgi:hypothetical protein